MAIAFVQRKVSAAAGTASSTATAAMSTTSGHLLVLVIQGQTTPSGTTISSVADTAGNTWTPTPHTPLLEAPSNANSGYIYYAKNITANASNVVTVTFSGSTGYVCCACYEFSGADTSTPLVSDQTGVGATGAAIATASFTLSGATCAIVAISEHDSSLTSYGTGYTGFSTDGGGFVDDEYHITSVDEAATMTQSGSSSKWYCLGAAFKSSTGGASFNPGWAYGATKIIGGVF